MDYGIRMVKANVGWARSWPGSAEHSKAHHEQTWQDIMAAVQSGQQPCPPQPIPQMGPPVHVPATLEQLRQIAAGQLVLIGRSTASLLKDALAMYDDVAGLAACRYDENTRLRRDLELKESALDRRTTDNEALSGQYWALHDECRSLRDQCATARKSYEKAAAQLKECEARNVGLVEQNDRFRAKLEELEKRNATQAATIARISPLLLCGIPFTSHKGL